jgi:hypothetical protein
VPHEFGVFVRSPVQLDRPSVTVKAAGLSFKILDEQVGTTGRQVSISTMHRVGMGGVARAIKAYRVQNSCAVRSRR